MTSLIQNQKTILDQLQRGEFVQGMEDYYADDVINEEATGASVQGKDKIIANERQFLETVENYHGCTVKSYGVGQDDGQGNGVTFAEYEIRADLKDGKTFNPNQVQVTRWENGKIKRCTFYYDPAKL